ncbi:hypothetical protein [Velocimicrobium porci]|uniref:Tetratricopeptide repeat protein n=1 Tax=Velocimicrobium porci TaxID=2606634 RepID=A0A6L5XXB9_9FIRM|nr:hypothetical protein [Velocimicrobium porci]MSS63510.1 hypothetical protein [Velocimicrobium porci]
MGKLILCHDSYAKEPFLFKQTNTKVYTIEEMCYYIYNNIYTITEELFDSTLYQWLEEQLDMNHLREKLLKVQREEHSLKDLIVIMLCSCDYFNEQEIRSLVETMDGLEKLSMQERKKLKADNLLFVQNYGRALEEYESMLKTENARCLTTEEYGDILHNIAVIHTRFHSYLEAAVLFKEAYSRNQKKESLEQYLYALKLAGNEKLLEEEITHFDVDETWLLEMEKNIKELKVKVEDTKEYQTVHKLPELKLEGLVNEYYGKIDQLLNEWKKEYRVKLGR